MEDVRSKILHARDRAREEVDVSEFWPEVGTLGVSVMGGNDRDSWEYPRNKLIDESKPLVGPFLVKCITDETGEKIFKEEDAEALGAKNWKALDKLFDVGWRINKLSKAEKEDIEKNSAAPAGPDSSS